MCHRTKVTNQPSLGILFLRLQFYGEDTHLVHDLWSLGTGYIQNLSLSASVNWALPLPNSVQTSLPSDHTFHGFAWTTLPAAAWIWKANTTCSLTVSSVLLLCHVKSKIFPPMSPHRYQVTLVKRAQHYWFSHPALPLQSRFVPSLSTASLLCYVMTQVHPPSLIYSQTAHKP